MSTKTSFKRIALVAAAALAIAGFSAVPANAALATTVAVVTNTSGTVYGTVGTAATAQLQLATTTAETGGSAGDSFTLVPTIASQPVGGGLTVGAPASGTVGLTSPAVTGNMADTATANKWTSTVSAGIQTLAYSSGTIPAQSAANVSTLSLTATVAGTYTVTVTPTGTLAGANTKTPVTVTYQIAGLAYSLGDGAAVSPATTGNGIAGPANTVTVNATTNASNTRSLVTVSGAGATINSNAGTALTAGATSTIVAAGTNAAIIINTPTAGTVTVSQFYESGNGTGIYASTASKTATITVGAAALNGTLSVANSTSIIDGTSPASTHNATADETVLVSKTQSTPTATEVAVIKVTLKDTLTNLMPDTTSLSATISGPGTLSIGSSQPTDAAGRAVSATTSSGVAYVNVYADGTEGVATITLSVGTTTVATETVTFYGTATKYVAVVKKAHIANSGSSTADVVEVTATDKAGNLVPSSTILATSGTPATATITSSATTASTGKALFAMTGLATKFGAVVVTFADAATAPTVTTTATVGVSSVLAKTVTAATDKASYSAGEKISWTLTFKDANGLGIPDGSYAAGTLLANSAANPVASASLASTPFAGNVALDVVAGVATATGYAPLAAGPVSYTWTIAGTAGASDTANLVTALQATTVTATAEVEADATASLALDAANAATDAANNAYDEAQNATQAASDALAAVTALAAQVKSLIASVKKLTAAVAKLKR